MAQKASVASRTRTITSSAQLNDRDRAFWKALQDSGKTSFTKDEYLEVGKTLGLTERTTKRRMMHLRAVGKVGIQHIYNIHNYATRSKVRAKKPTSNG